MNGTGGHRLSLVSSLSSSSLSSSSLFLLSIVAIDWLLVVLAANILLCIYRRHCRCHRRHHATETSRLGLAVITKRNAKNNLSSSLFIRNVRKTIKQTVDSQQKYVTKMKSFCANDVSM